MERRLIAEWDQKLSTRVSIRRIESPDERNEKFKDFCDDLTATAAKVEVLVKTEDASARPALEIGDGLSFYAIPTGPELAPFLEAVAALDPAYPRRPAGDPHTLASLASAVTIQVFIAPFCRFCPDVVRAFAALPRLSEFIKVNVIDGVLFPELAAPYSIKSAPTVILNDRHRWTGQPDMAEIVEILTVDDPASWNQSTFETMIQEGNALQIAELALKSGTIPVSLADLLAHESLSVRLGALVALEEIASANPGLAAQLVEPLWKRFPDADQVAQGDILYALGEIKSRKSTSGLKAILDGPYDEAIKESAQEALEKLNVE